MNLLKGFACLRLAQCLLYIISNRIRGIVHAHAGYISICDPFGLLLSAAGAESGEPTLFYLIVN